MVQEASGSHGLLEVSGSDVGLELIQEDDAQPYENTCKIHDEVMLAEVEPQNVKIPIRRSARIPQLKTQYQENNCYKRTRHPRGDSVQHRSLAVVAALHSRTHRFEDKLMDLEPHIFRMLLDLLRTRVNLEANVPIFEKDQYLCSIELAIIYARTDDIEFRRLQARGMLWTGTISNTYVEVVQCEISVEFRDIEGYRDLRQQTPVHTQQLPNRCYALSVKHPLMVVGTADRNLIAFNLQNQIHHRIRRDKKLTWDELLPQSEADKIGMICLNS
ncbi:retrotransposon protein, putative, ty1-copia subclass [Tanacetum coccineum]